MIDWKNEAKKYEKDYLADLKDLVAIDSSRDIEHSTDDFPLGPGPAKALEKFLAIAKRDGFVTKNIDNIVGYIEFGTGDKYFAMLGHADTVPAGKGWDTNPFQMTIEDGNVVGRGTSDDKGPALAAYYGLKMLKDNNIVPNLKIRLIIGTDEETNWTGMKRYFEVEPAPELGFSPDAEFPLINGEKGNVTFETEFKGQELPGKNTLISFNSGIKENMVPRDAEAIIDTKNGKQIASDFEKFLLSVPVTGTYEINGQQLKLEMVGKAAHGMEPKNGINAGTYLASFLHQYELDESGENFIGFIADKLQDDSRANKLGLKYTDDIMGDLTMNVGIMRYDVQDGGMVNTNFRYPKGVTVEKIQQQLQDNTAYYGGRVELIDDMVPNFVSPTDPLVTTLMNIYKSQTDQQAAEPEVVGGGTYARMMKHGVAFGALFPGAEDTMHQANEFQSINDLLLAMSIYGQSIFELTK
ncbi:Beta-Ala-Xaa dipeptidase [Fructilactobacillus lindneri DSM 20690 = JCM 11027]|uniref:Beta-Ala-Xaa dipeptidase n=2 Tax=Fructilactobacillus lindneri TaxID=53444 RepID=A0A0R2JP12_9LACO|nr:Beta-Ala-Xaa dipeptidase [Fructilactobacillus lindneri DSM 20690 = JCM 11027]SJZ80655.1 peptidase V. Metallo peptidase. MEROPS family M20A [Fructilactobacillus lindneri DSM 20690 = JCM 11027]